MKKLKISGFFLTVVTAVVISGCGSGQEPARIYMPDMAHSRAYEAYSLHDTMKFTSTSGKRGGNFIYYNSMPVNGTMKRGEMFPYALPNDSIGYKASAGIKNPIDTIDAASLAEAGRLYNINCAICHGAKGAADGPLATGAKIGGVANIATGEKANLSDGTMFHVMTYGKGIMGSYASQLTRQQRWQIVKYIRTLQKPTSGGGNAADSTGSKKTDSSAVAKK